MADYFDAKLAGTSWTVNDISNFIAKYPEEAQHSNKSTYTWREAYNETEQAIHTISLVMEVSFKRFKVCFLHNTIESFVLWFVGAVWFWVPEIKLLYHRGEPGLIPG